MAQSIQFSDENIRKLFGNEAADSESIDRLREYYVKLDVYKRMQSEIPLYLLVGHKGTGKSALFNVLCSECKNSGCLPIVITPSDILEIQTDDTNFLRRIKLWKEGLARIIVQKSHERVVMDSSNAWISKIGALFSSALDVTIDKGLEIGNLSYSKIITLFNNSIFTEKRVIVFIDDVDRGWSNAKEDISNLSAMLNAIRDLQRDCEHISFRVSLRSDVYYAVRTSDETTDKIDGSVVWLKWNNHEIFVMLVKRILAFRKINIADNALASMDQKQLAGFLNGLFEDRFMGVGHWNKAPMYRVLMSLIRKRPRDLVKLCTLAAGKARERGHKIIMTEDLESIFPTYSNDRLLDTGNEYKSEMPAVKDLLLAMKPTTKEIQEHRASKYTYADLLHKIGNIQQNIPLRFSNGRVCDKKAIAAFLYKINFLTARKITSEGIQRLYYDENQYLHNEFTNFGYDYEIHPAYRWALQPDSIGSRTNDIDLDVDI